MASAGPRRELSRRGDLDHLEIGRMATFDVPDAGRLIDATAFAQAHAADTFVFELHPALEDVNHLEPELVIVALGLGATAASRADDMGEHLAVRGFRDA